jgi:hypothetical protein
MTGDVLPFDPAVSEPAPSDDPSGDVAPEPTDAPADDPIDEPAPSEVPDPIATETAVPSDEPAPSEEPVADDATDEPAPRFSTEGCPEGFSGNHGRFVSGSEGPRSEAAHSPCGKPTKANKAQDGTE